MTINPKKLKTMQVVATVVFDHQYPVTWKAGKTVHVVTYGKQIKRFPIKDDIAACHEFGECVRHAAECEGVFNV